MRNKIKIIIKSLVVVVVAITTVFTATTPTHAISITNVTVEDSPYTFDWHSTTPIGPYQMVSAYGMGLNKIYADGLLVTCFDPGTLVGQGGGYVGSPTINSDIESRLSRLAAANNIDSMNQETYAAFQLYQHMIMFGSSGFVIDRTNVTNLQGYINQFEANSANYWKAPTFNFGDGTIKQGETKTFNVTNGVTTGWSLINVSAGVSATFSNGKLTITNNNLTNATIDFRFQKEVGTYKRSSMIYNKPNSQNLGLFGITDPDYATFQLRNVLVKTDLVVNKTDEYSGELLLGYDDIELTLYSDVALTQVLQVASVNPITGQATFSQIPYGTTAYLKETGTIQGYYLSDTVVKIVFDNSLSGLGGVHVLTYTNKPIPTIGTLATGINGEKALDPTMENILIDKSEIVNIDTSLTYTILTQLHAADGTVVFERTYEDITFDEVDTMFISELAVPANLLIEGDYYFSETFYEKGKDDPLIDQPIVEHNDPTDEGQTIRMEKEKYFINVNKVDSITGKNIINKDFKFKVEFYKENKLVETQIVAGDVNTGIASITFHGKGTYDEIHIKEIESPKGYLLSNEVEVVKIEDFNEMNLYSFECSNEPLQPVKTGVENNLNMSGYLMMMTVSAVVVHLLRNKKGMKF